jgi:hypothetical protein
MSTFSQIAADINKRYEAERFAILEAARVFQELDRSRTAALQAIVKPLEDHRRMMESLNRTLREPIRQAQAQQKAIAEAIADIMALTRDAPWKRLSAVTMEFARIQSQASEIASVYASVRTGLCAVALLPSFTGTQHIRQTLRLSQLWEQAGKPVAPLASSVACTQLQVAAQDEEILQYPDVFHLDELQATEEAALAVLPPQNLYQVQRAELVLVARTSPDALEKEEVVDSLPSFEYTKVAQALCALVPLINQQCAARGDREIFKPTNQLIRALVTLPNLIAVSRDMFATFVDCLYFVIYEGGGGNSLRFLGLLDDSQAAPVWAIKHFRNLDLRHDVEHGTSKEIQKKQLALAEDYSRLIGVPTPRTRRDFRNAQLTLLKQAVAMLRAISDAIEALPPRDLNED